MKRGLAVLMGLLLLAGAAVAGCTPESAATPGPEVSARGEVAIEEPGPASEPFKGATVLSEGDQLRYEELDAEFLVITDQESWASFWRSYAPEGQTEAPQVNFDTAFVLVGVQGVKSTGGYEISFRDLEQSGDEVRVLTDIQEPAAGEQAEAAFTQPYTIVEVDTARLTAPGPLTFVFETDSGERLGQVTQTVPPEREPEADRPKDELPLGTTILAQGSQLAYEDPRPTFLVITGDEAWDAFWQTYAPEGQTVGPAVNWRRSFVLVGTQGAKPTAGYGISFVALRQSGDEAHVIHVITALKEPDPGESVEMVLTQPYIVEQVELSSIAALRTPLTFIFETEAGEELGRVEQAVGQNPELEPAGERPSAPSELEEPFRGAVVIAQGLTLRYEEPSPLFFVISDNQGWADFWRTYLPEGRRVGPPVDFSRTFVLVGLQGSKSTGGYSIDFRGLVQHGDQVRAVIGLTEPEPGGSAEAAFTQPYVIVGVDRTELTHWGSLTFIFETEGGEVLGRVDQTNPN